ncbi:MAG: putative serine/arginine repetitive matrix protein 1 [Actinomycetia bacterium]|nr:putative serine/arginine repetitive matrix protein 1 [Actinomycetes bacterium]
MTRDVLRHLTEARPEHLDPGAPIPTGTREKELTTAMAGLREQNTETPRQARRAVRPLWGVGLIAAAGVTAAAVVVATTGTGGKTVEGPSATVEGPRATAQALRLQLAAYTGTQPVGFKVNTVPAGWHVTSSSTAAFMVAPPGKLPGVKKVPAGGQLVSLEGQIVVMLQGMSRLPSDSPVTKVTIHGKEGQLGSPKGGNSAMQAVWLIFPDAAGHKILVQVPKSVGLTNDQIVRFAQGISVTKHAESTGG